MEQAACTKNRCTSFAATLSHDDSHLSMSVIPVATSAKITGAKMQVRWLRGGRGVRLAAAVAVYGALWASSAQAFTEEDQRRLCTGDVFRLCSSEIPDRER